MRAGETRVLDVAVACGFKNAAALCAGVPQDLWSEAYGVSIRNSPVRVSGHPVAAYWSPRSTFACGNEKGCVLGEVIGDSEAIQLDIAWISTASRQEIKQRRDARLSDLILCWWTPQGYADSARRCKGWSVGVSADVATSSLALATLWSMKSTIFSSRTQPTGSASSRLRTTGNHAIPW